MAALALWGRNLQNLFMFVLSQGSVEKEAYFSKSQNIKRD